MRESYPVPDVATEVKEQLRQEYRKLNPLARRRQMRGFQAALWELALSDTAIPAVLQALASISVSPFHQAAMSASEAVEPRLDTLKVL